MLDNKEFEENSYNERNITEIEQPSIEEMPPYVEPMPESSRPREDGPGGN